MAEGRPPRTEPAFSPAELAELELLAQGAEPESTVREAVGAIFAASAARLGSHQPLLGFDLDGEAVHQARVATRRLRSDLHTFAPLLDEQWTRSLRGELKWLAALLGEVRDADVLMQRMIEGLGQVEGPAAGRQEVLRPLTARRDQARREMLEGVAGRRQARLMRSVLRAGRRPPVVDRAGEVAGDVLPGFAVKPWKRLDAAVGQLGENPSDDQLHFVRIAAKRARYASEAVEPVVGPPARRFAQAVAGLQEALGDYHDAVVARQWLEELAPTLRRGGSYYAGALAERERARSRSALQAWETAWRQASRKRLRRWMP